MNRTASWLITLHALTLAMVIAWSITFAHALQAIGKPFPGFLAEATMLVSTLRYPDWNGARAGIATYDRLVKANDQALESPADLDRLVRHLPVGSPVTYEVIRDGRKLRLTIETQTFEASDFMRSSLPWFISSAGFLLIGAIVFWLRPRHPAAQAHLLLTLAWAIFLALFVDTTVMHRFPRFYLSAIFLLGSTFLHLALTFPEPMAWFNKRPLIGLLPYAPVLLASALTGIAFRPLGFSASAQSIAFHSHHLSAWSLWTALCAVYFIAHCSVLAWRGKHARIRQQAGAVLIGTVASFLPAILIFLIPQLLGQITRVPTWLPILEMACFHLFPLSIAYAIIRHQLFDIRLVIRRTTLYALLIAGLAVLYLAVAGIAFALLGRFFPIHSGPSLPGFIAALMVALAFRPLHDRLRRAVDRLILGERANALQVLAGFSRKTLPDEPTVASELLKVVERALQPRWVCLVLANQTRHTLGEEPGYLEGACRSSNKTGFLSLRDLVPEAEDQALALTFKVTADRQHCLFIGPAESDMPYNFDEHAMLRALAGQAAIAFQNAHLTEERIQLSVQEGLARHKATERKQLLMQIVHDLKSDLFNISLALHLAEKKPDHPDALDSIKRSLDRIDSLLDEKVSVIKEGRERSACSLLPPLKEAMATLAPQLAQKEQRLDFRGPEADCEVPLSLIELKQVVVNLINNASKFSPTRTTITLQARVTDGNVVVRVTDEGPGLSETLLADLASGKRADASAPGSGFGLQNVKALVEGSGGSLTWQNGSKGAIFEVRLPLLAGNKH